MAIYQHFSRDASSIKQNLVISISIKNRKKRSKTIPKNHKKAERNSSFVLPFMISRNIYKKKIYLKIREVNEMTIKIRTVDGNDIHVKDDGLSLKEFLVKNVLKKEVLQLEQENVVSKKHAPIVIMSKHVISYSQVQE